MNDTEIGVQVLWAFSHILDWDKEAMDLVMENATLQTISHRLSHPSTDMRRAALRVLGNICSGPVDYVEKVLASGCIPTLQAWVRPHFEDQELLKEACWLLSNVAVGPTEHIQLLIDAGLVKQLVDVCSDCPARIVACIC